MCICVAKKAGLRLTKDCLRNCFNANRDGAGFAYVHPTGEVCIKKGFFEFDKFWEHYEPVQDLTCAIHFRVSTCRAVNGKNCHPWRVNDDLVFIHNGMISNMNQNSELSDTGNFCETILKPLIAKAPNWYLTEDFAWLINNAITKYNKLVFLDSKGNFVIVHENEGYWDQGVWFSNNGYKGYGANFKVLENQESKPIEVNSAEENSDPSELESQLNTETTPSSQDGETQYFDNLADLDEELERRNNSANLEMAALI